MFQSNLFVSVPASYVTLSSVQNSFYLILTSLLSLTFFSLFLMKECYTEQNSFIVNNPLDGWTSSRVMREGKKEEGSHYLPTPPTSPIQTPNNKTRTAAAATNHN